MLCDKLLTVSNSIIEFAFKRSSTRDVFLNNNSY